MRKMIMVLMMVFGLSAVFADSYVAFTSEEGFEEYCNSDHSEWDADQKALFEEYTAYLSDNQKKNFSLIIVCGDNDDAIKNHIIVFNVKPKTYGVIVFDDNFYIITYRMVYTTEKQDLVLVGLPFIKDQVTHIVDIDNQTVIFESCDVVKK